MPNIEAAKKYRSFLVAGLRGWVACFYRSFLKVGFILYGWILIRVNTTRGSATLQ